MKMAFRRIGLKTLATFLHSLANMTSAGLPILRSLASIQSSQRDPRLRRALAIAQQIDGDRAVEVDGMDLVVMEGDLVKRNEVYFDRAVIASLM